MTTIATDGKSMAGDSQVTAGGSVVEYRNKVEQTDDGRIFAGCGPSTDCIKFAKWMRSETNSPTLSDEFSALVLLPTGEAFWVDKNLEPSSVMLPAAIGSGQEYAIGAMLAGRDPKEAVRIACMRDSYSGGAITAEKIQPFLEVAA